MPISWLRSEQGFCVGEDASPRPGDATICGNCQKILIFTETLALRQPTREEREEGPHHPGTAITLDGDNAWIAEHLAMGHPTRVRL